MSKNNCEVVSNFVEELIKSNKPLEPEIQELINDHFWELL